MTIDIEIGVGSYEDIEIKALHRRGECTRKRCPARPLALFIGDALRAGGGRRGDCPYEPTAC
jgi:hypothetical protein